MHVRITDEQFEDLLLQYLIEHRTTPSAALATIARVLGVSAIHLETTTSGSALEAEWHSRLQREVGALAAKIMHEEREFFLR